MSVFKFKQFDVDQTGCAMKINTDGVLLAVLVEGDQPKSVLDIGTGTGVIAMMLAQRFVRAQIHAVEIDKQAAETAEKNFSASPFSDRLSISSVSIAAFEKPGHFDLIVSNPPYFVNDLKSSNVQKKVARHASEGFFEDLLAKVKCLLTAHGRFWFILPVKQADELIDIAFTQQLYIAKQWLIHSDRSKPLIRKVVCLTKVKRETPETLNFYIYEDEKIYTDSYKRLLAPFFIGY